MFKNLILEKYYIKDKAKNHNQLMKILIKDPYTNDL